MITTSTPGVRPPHQHPCIVIAPVQLKIDLLFSQSQPIDLERGSVPRQHGIAKAHLYPAGCRDLARSTCR